MSATARELILLGAGASVEAGVPDAYGMSREMVRLFSDTPKLSAVLRFAVGGLLFQRGVMGDDPFDGVNIEELFNAVQLLAEREQSEVAPFVGAWHPVVHALDRLGPPRADFNRLHEAIIKSALETVARSGKDSIKSSFASAFDRALREAIGGKRPSSPGKVIADQMKDAFERLSRKHPRRDFQFGSEMSRAVNQKDRPGRGYVFRVTNQRMIKLLAKMVWLTDPRSVAYLAPLFRAPHGASRVFATVNYDNALELSASAAGITLDTGIDEWSQTGSFNVSPPNVPLLKLHGSIDWALREAPTDDSRPLPSQQIERIAPADVPKAKGMPAVIFGGRNKLTATGPYLDLLRAFQAALSQCDRLSVIGYSFRDDHLNEYISQWVNGDSVRRLRIINGPSFRQTVVPFARMLLGSLKDRLEVVEAKAAEGIARSFVEHGQ
ncbi:MAG: SIR2 family protein [Pirellulales bacterium]